MEVIIYAVAFIIGTLLGSFFTLAVYRIPLKQDITHKRSYCPKCNHRLEFLDLIPILSYIFLHGRCRYCKEKIRPRYILFEIFSGIIFLLFIISKNINIYEFNITMAIELFIGIFFISILFIIGGIEKETHKISKETLTVGFVMQLIYMIYLYLLNISNYKYVMYILLGGMALLLNLKRNERKKSKSYRSFIAYYLHYTIH